MLNNAVERPKRLFVPESFPNISWWESEQQNI